MMLNISLTPGEIYRFKEHVGQPFSGRILFYPPKKYPLIIRSRRKEEIDLLEYVENWFIGYTPDGVREYGFGRKELYIRHSDI